MRKPGPEDEALLRAAARRRGEAPRGAAGCLDEETLAGLAAGSLLEEERAAAEAHCRACAPCREVLVALVRAVPSGEGRPRRGLVLGLSRRVVAAAAVVLALVAGGALIVRALGPRRETDELLVASARDVAAAHPALFPDGLAPLGPQERTAVAPPARGGEEPVLLHPAGVILETRPTFRWEPVAGVAGHEIALHRLDRLLWSVRVVAPATHAGWPAGEPELPRGVRLRWEVRVAGARGEVRVSRAFRVATAEEASAWDAVRAAIDERAPRRIRSLLRAHAALRRGLWAEAERAAREFREAEPDDAVGRETLDHVLRLRASSTSPDSR